MSSIAEQRWKATAIQRQAQINTMIDEIRSLARQRDRLRARGDAMAEVLTSFYQVTGNEQAREVVQEYRAACGEDQ